MSKARQLADLLDSNGDVVAGALDNAPDPDLTPYARTADLLDGGGNIQSGLLGNAPETDLTPVKQDLGILAFESARSDNRSAYNLSNAFIDQFEDASGIDTFSNCQKPDTSEHITSINAVPGLLFDGWRVHTYTRPSSCTWKVQYSDNNSSWTDAGSSGSAEVTSTWTSKYTWSNSTPRRYWRWYKTTGASGGGYHTELEIYYGSTNVTNKISGSNISGSGLVGFDANRLVDGNLGGGGISFHTDSSGVGSWFKIDASSVTTGDDFATANFTGVTQSASSSVSEMSVVVMYEDSAGTATLNTDLVVQVSANNGTDWTTVNLASAPNLSGSIKVAKSNAVAVTSGTQPKYRINFANQAAGSKVTRVLGVSLLY